MMLLLSESSSLPLSVFNQALIFLKSTKLLFLYSQTEIDDMIRKFANVLLMRTLGGCLAGLIKQPHLTLLQVFASLHLCCVGM